MGSSCSSATSTLGNVTHILGAKGKKKVPGKVERTTSHYPKEKKASKAKRSRKPDEVEDQDINLVLVVTEELKQVVQLEEYYRKLVEDYIPIFREDGFPSYPLSEGYTKNAGKDKQSILWMRTKDKPYGDNRLPNIVTPKIDLLAIVAKPVDVHNDQIDEFYELIEGAIDLVGRGRKRNFYAFGAVAAADFHVTEPQLGYTGIFNSGAPCMLRISLRNPVRKSSDPVVVGLELKALIDNRPSKHIFALPGSGLNGQWTQTGSLEFLEGKRWMDKTELVPDRNIFTQEFSNVIQTRSGIVPWVMGAIENAGVVAGSCLAAPSGKSYSIDMLEELASTGSIGLEDAASANSRGLEEPHPLAPYKIIFTPTSELMLLINPTDTTDFRVLLATLPADTVIFTVSVCAKENDLPQKLGEIRTVTSFVSSKYGDEFLYFQHPPYYGSTPPEQEEGDKPKSQVQPNQFAHLRMGADADRAKLETKAKAQLDEEFDAIKREMKSASKYGDLNSMKHKSIYLMDDDEDEEEAEGGESGAIQNLRYFGKSLSSRLKSTSFNELA